MSSFTPIDSSAVNRIWTSPSTPAGQTENPETTLSENPQEKTNFVWFSHKIQGNLPANITPRHTASISANSSDNTKPPKECVWIDWYKMQQVKRATSGTKVNKQQNFRENKLDGQGNLMGHFFCPPNPPSIPSSSREPNATQCLNTQSPTEVPAENGDNSLNYNEFTENGLRTTLPQDTNIETVTPLETPPAIQWDFERHINTQRPTGVPAENGDNSLNYNEFTENGLRTTLPQKTNIKTVTASEPLPAIQWDFERNINTQRPTAALNKTGHGSSSSLRDQRLTTKKINMVTTQSSGTCVAPQRLNGFEDIDSTSMASSSADPRASQSMGIQREFREGFLKKSGTCQSISGPRYIVFQSMVENDTPPEEILKEVNRMFAENNKPPLTLLNLKQRIHRLKKKLGILPKKTD